MVLAFFRQIPQAILRAIVAHMKLTDPNELDRLVATEKRPLMPDKKFSSGDDDGSTPTLQRRKTIPLTPARIEFLMNLLDPGPKPV